MPALAQSAPRVTFYLAVVALTLIAGRGPAILVMVSGAFAAAYLFVEPRFSLRPHTLEDFVWLAFYSLVSGAIIVAIESRTMAARLAKERLEAIEVEQQKRQRPNGKESSNSAGPCKRSPASAVQRSRRMPAARSPSLIVSRRS